MHLHDSSIQQHMESKGIQFYQQGYSTLLESASSLTEPFYLEWGYMFLQGTKSMLLLLHNSFLLGIYDQPDLEKHQVHKQFQRNLCYK